MISRRLHKPTIGKCLLLAFAVQSSSLAFASPNVAKMADLRAELLSGNEAIEASIFNFGILLDENSLVKAALESSTIWRNTRRNRKSRVVADLSRCGDKALCKVQAMRWTDEEIKSSAEHLPSALQQNGQSAALAGSMRDSGLYARHQSMADGELISLAWTDTLRALNQIIDVYGLGMAPKYPVIDAISFDPSSALWHELLSEVLDRQTSRRMDFASTRLWSLRTDPGYELALKLLYLNDRESAASFPDLDKSDNRPALQNIAQLQWADYPYSIILVLGDGPENPNDRVGSFGKLRLEHACELFRKGMAPLIMVSGGNVHPARTPINEAQEMKRELIMRYRIPENAIIMEPHARHTTTNFRNATRLMLRYGIPSDKPALVTSSASHSSYAFSEEFDQRARTELGYIPRIRGNRLSDYDFEFHGDRRSTHRDAKDPLDP